MIKTRITAESFDPGAELTALTGAADAGAVASFVGQVRGDHGVTTLELEHYPGRTDAALDAIARAAAARWDLTQARIVHRVGRMGLGEPIVFVGAAAPHRRAALEAAAYLIDVLKTQAPFWKKEIGADFERWVEPTTDDAAAADQWLAAEPALVEELGAHG
ncbi:MAG: molybdenum cofactor biosynthesis protein MoaE [Maricaulaceae bacterium]|jgi:molybdopterin synthase catalytic subunit